MSITTIDHEDTSKTENEAYDPDTGRKTQDRHPSAPISPNQEKFSASGLFSSISFADFVSSRKRVSAKAFGTVLGNPYWKKSSERETEFLVYRDIWYIEITHDGEYVLSLENLTWMTGNGLNLIDLEYMLFTYLP